MKPLAVLSTRHQESGRTSPILTSYKIPFFPTSGSLTWSSGWLAELRTLVAFSIPVYNFYRSRGFPDVPKVRKTMPYIDPEIKVLRQSKNEIADDDNDGSTGGMGREEMIDQVALTGEGAYDQDIYGGGDKFAG